MEAANKEEEEPEELSFSFGCASRGEDLVCDRGDRGDRGEVDRGDETPRGRSIRIPSRRSTTGFHKEG